MTSDLRWGRVGNHKSCPYKLNADHAAEMRIEVKLSLVFHLYHSLV